MAVLHLDVEGIDLPGRRWGPTPDACYTNIHIGLGDRRAPTGLVPGDAATATWHVEVTVMPGADGTVDFRGPLVAGPRGERHLPLRWGDVAEDGTFHLFGGAKLRLAEIDPALVRDALQPGKRLVGRLRLTDARGRPRCASVRPPDIAWSIADHR